MIIDTLLMKFINTQQKLKESLQTYKGRMETIDNQENKICCCAHKAIMKDYQKIQGKYKRWKNHKGQDKNKNIVRHNARFNSSPSREERTSSSMISAREMEMIIGIIHATKGSTGLNKFEGTCREIFSSTNGRNCLQGQYGRGHRRICVEKDYDKEHK